MINFSVYLRFWSCLLFSSILKLREFIFLLICQISIVWIVIMSRILQEFCPRHQSPFKFVVVWDVQKFKNFKSVLSFRLCFECCVWGYHSLSKPIHILIHVLVTFKSLIYLIIVYIFPIYCPVNAIYLIFFTFDFKGYLIVMI